MGLILLTGAAARANMCILPKNVDGVYKNDAWTGNTNGFKFTGAGTGGTVYTGPLSHSGKTDDPCSYADSLDGTPDDGIITLEFAPGQDIDLDLVVAQATDATFAFYTFSVKVGNDEATTYADLSDPPNCDCIPCDTKVSHQCAVGQTKCDKPVIGITPDLDGSVSDFVTNWITNDGTNYFVINAATLADFVSTSFVAETITYANTFAADDTSTLFFDGLASTPKKSYVADENSCYLTAASCSGGRKWVPPSTKINFVQPPCYTGKPTITGLACNPTSVCTQTPPSGTAAAVMTFTNPTKCYTSSALTTETACVGTLGTKISGGAAIPSSPYTDDTKAIGDTASYTIVGTSGCSDSPEVDSAVVACNCGAPPVITMTSPASLATTKYIQGQDIKIVYHVEEDPDYPDLALTQLNFYYLTDTGAALPIPSTDLLTSIEDGNVTATIPGKVQGSNFVLAGSNIYFGIIAADSNGQTAFPPTLDISSVALFATDTASIVPGTNIIIGSRFDFIEGNEPLPCQFPFRVGGDQVAKITFRTNDTGTVSARIYSLDGKLIRHLDSSTSAIGDCDHSPTAVNVCNNTEGCVWDGTTYQGGSNFVAPGLYIFNIHAVCSGTAFPGGVIDYTKGIVIER
jgi:hypothetical protein